MPCHNDYRARYLYATTRLARTDSILLDLISRIRQTDNRGLFSSPEFVRATAHAKELRSLGGRL